MSDTRARLLATVVELLHRVLGEDFALEMEIDEETSFSDDLELESIEFVMLAEALQERYGEKIDFTAWLSGMELDAIVALSVGDLVDLLERSGVTS